MSLRARKIFLFFFLSVGLKMEELSTIKVERLHFPVKSCIFMKTALDSMENGADHLVSGNVLD